MRKFINFLIKREQSRTSSGFAECEKSRLKAKLTMTLALLIAAVSGAWAQSSLNVVAFDVPANWETDDSPVTAGDLTGFKTSTLDEAKAWTGAPAKGMAVLVYAFDGGKVYYVIFANGVTSGASANFRKSDFFIQKSQWKYYYTTEPTEWSLTPDETGKKWTLDKMPASNIELHVEYEPTKVTMAANDKTMGTVEVAGESKVEWTADTWKGWTYDTKEYTVDDITMTSSQSAYIRENTDEGKYKNSLSFGVIYSSDKSTVTFSTTGDPFSRIEFTMIDDYSESNPNNPHILPVDNWTFEGKSAVWEGEATKSLTLQSCSTNVSKITFYKGAIPDGVTVNGDGTFTVAKTATVTLKATPAEGYKFLYWEDDKTNTNPVREVTIESGMADMTYKAVFAEILYNVTFVEGTNLDEWTATPNTEVKKDTKVDIKYNGTKKVIGVKVEKKAAAATPTLAEATAEDYGKVVCAAGHLHDAKTAVPSGCTAVGILGKVTETGHGLILALQNATNQDWNTINGWASASYAGTTLKVLPDDTARGSLTSYTTLGETTVSNWAVAQKSDYEAIFTNLGSTKGDSDGMTYDANVNAYITEGVGGTAISGRYWSATERDGDNAWDFHSNCWASNSKTSSYILRPVLGF